MSEDFNEGPLAIEEKQSIIDFIDDKSLKIEQIECGDCHFQFCDLNTGIESHLNEYHHNLLSIRNGKDKSKVEEIKCAICSEKNIFKLFIIAKDEEDKSVIELKKIIYCENHIPIGFPRQKILDILELDAIIKRKLNKVKLTYENKNDYYEIYKPLVIADMIYTKKIYDTKLEYPIVLECAKNGKYFFKIDEDFTEIEFRLGRVLKFSEEEKYCENYSNSEDEEENKAIQFLGVVLNNELSEKNEENKNTYTITILPINKHVTSLKGHTGQYKIKEEFCLIPYERMLSALDLFVNDCPDEEDQIFDRPVSLYLTRRIMGDFPTNKDLKEDKKGDIKKKFEEYRKIEKESIDDYLFENDIISKLITSKKDFGELNPTQIGILKNVFSNVLNLIQGPPGTGKTFLSSFITYNIFNFRKDKSEKILLCAPSNSASDNLALNLIKLNKAIGGKMKILRIYAKSREMFPIKSELLEISLHYTLEHYPEKGDKEEKEIIEEIINSTDIVISTCSTSWDDRIKGFPFPFILIDESTQCCEIETLIPIVSGCKHLTLIGDQKQLPPVVLHPKATKTGMNISLFERMVKLYPELFNMLTIQYRMHPKIAQFSSQEFYENKIINGITLKDKTDEEFNLKFNWPINDVPLIFVHMNGEEKVMKSGKSKRNEEEANTVVLFVEKLNNCGVDFNNIGIITPYTAQKLLIQEKLNEKYKNNKEKNEKIKILKISSVDGFQGGEKDFIILSNVRSNRNNQIGFLKDFRRLNVSITRAKYGMIIIGNVNCLYHNKSIWRNFINYYIDNKLIFVPEIKENKEGKIINIDNLKYYNITKEDNIDSKYIYKEYDFDSSKNEPGINEDLLNNFECCENVYLQGNKKHLKKKKKKNKNKKKNKHNQK
jgi:hypothetical protein